MAIRNGNLVPSAEILPLPGISANISGGRSVAYMHHDACTIAISGAASDPKPIVMFELQYDGVKVPTYLEDYYFRIHVWEREYNLGPILSDVQRSMYVWNAFVYADQSKTCNSLTITGIDHVSLDDMTAPFTLLPVQWKEYRFTVAKSGGPIIDCDIEFDFGADGIYVVSVTGNRLTLSFLRPQGDVEEHLEWLTTILESYNGTPQAISERRIPRQFLKYSYHLEDINRSKLEALMHTWLKKTWGLPVWTEMVEDWSTISAGAMSIAVDTRFADFRDNSLGVLWQAGQQEVIEIETKTDAVLNLKSAVKNTYTGYKVIAPIRFANVIESAKKKVTASGYTIVDITYVMSDNIIVTGHTPAATYDGYEVLTKRTYVDTFHNEQWDNDVVILDNGVSKFELLGTHLYNKITQNHIFYNDTKEECWRFRQFIHSLFGMQKVILVPTFREDLEIVTGTGFASDSIFVRNVGLATNMGVNDLRSYVGFMDGSNLIVRKIRALTEVDSTTERIDLDIAPGIDVPIGMKLCFVDKVRLASDKLKIQWPEAHRNEVKASFLRTK